MLGTSCSAVAFATLVVTAISLTLVGFFLAASWISGWYEVRARRIQEVARRGQDLRPGYRALRGKAWPLDGRAGGVLATHTSTQLRESRFGEVVWRDLEGSSKGEPFALVLESGEEIEIDPKGAAMFALTRVTMSPYRASGSQNRLALRAVYRDVVLRLSAGDEVWVTGMLSRAEQQGAGAYRSTTARRTMRPPRRAKLEISGELPAARWRAIARAHRKGAYAAMASLAVVHVLLYRPITSSVLAALRASRGGFDGAIPENACVVRCPIAHDHVALLILVGLAGVALAGISWYVSVLRAKVVHDRR